MIRTWREEIGKGGLSHIVRTTDEETGVTESVVFDDEGRVFYRTVATFWPEDQWRGSTRGEVIHFNADGNELERHFLTVQD
jgi:hypothetical protein